MTTVEKTQYRYFTREALIAANEEAVAAERNQTLKLEPLKELNPFLRYPLVRAVSHNDVEMRLLVMMGHNGPLGLLDVPFKTYEDLPQVALYRETLGGVGREMITIEEVKSEESEDTSESDVPQLETVTAYKCTECDEINEEYADKLYECANCGTVFTRDNSADGGSHRCPDCNKFGSKLADKACVDCEEGEVEEVQVYVCEHCSDFHEETKELAECLS